MDKVIENAIFLNLQKIDGFKKKRTATKLQMTLAKTTYDFNADDSLQCNTELSIGRQAPCAKLLELLGLKLYWAIWHYAHCFSVFYV
jgi:hypothetical protein